MKPSTRQKATAGIVSKLPSNRGKLVDADSLLSLHRRLSIRRKPPSSEIPAQDLIWTAFGQVWVIASPTDCWCSFSFGVRARQSFACRQLDLIGTATRVCHWPMPLLGISRTYASGPSGKFCNIQSHCASANQGAFRRQWPLPWQETQHRVALAQRLPKGRATSIVGGVAALGKGLPFPADCALPTMLVARLSVTELSTWPTRHDVLTCPASTYVGYVEVGHITQSHIEGAGHERGYRKSHQSADGSGAE